MRNMICMISRVSKHSRDLCVKSFDKYRFNKSWIYLGMMKYLNQWWPFLMFQVTGLIVQYKREHITVLGNRSSTVVNKIFAVVMMTFLYVFCTDFVENLHFNSIFNCNYYNCHFKSALLLESDFFSRIQTFQYFFPWEELLSYLCFSTLDYFPLFRWKNHCLKYWCQVLY